MIETLFSPPHNATAEEAHRVRARYAGLGLDAMRLLEEALDTDQRLTTLYELHALRHDVAGMEDAAARIADRAWAAELAYRDVYPASHFSEPA